MHVDPVAMEWVQSLVTILVAVLASGGFWSFIQHKSDRTTAETKLMLGLAHNELIRQGLKYIDRGYILKDEYDDYVKYLYAPYSTFGGNGLAEKIFNEVSELPIRKYPPAKTARQTLSRNDKIDRYNQKVRDDSFE